MSGSNTTDSGNNVVESGALFGANFAVVGDGSMGSGNNTGGGINIAVEPPGATSVGNCASALCVNLFGVNL